MPPLTWTTRSLINRSLSLLCEHPVLVVPVGAADLLCFAAMHIQHALHQPLLAWVFGHSESVLASSRSAFVLTPQNAAEAAFLTVPLVWGCFFLTVCFYTGALLMTSALVRKVGNSDLPDLRSAYVHVVTNRRRILRFSMAMFGALIIAAIVAGISISGSMKIPGFASVAGRDLGYLIALPLEIALVYLLTRPALTLLSEAQNPPAGAILHTAKLFGFVTVSGQWVLVLLIEHSAPAFLFQQKTVFGFLVREAIVSLIAASTYVPLFIGLSLLANRTQQTRPFSGAETAEES